MIETLCIRLPVIAVFAIAVGVTAAHADRTVTEQSRTVYHFAKVEAMPVGDVPGHVVVLADQRGLTTTDTGEVGVWASKVFLDLTNGIGPHQTYTVTTFEDKSTTVSRATGRTTEVAADGSSSFEGTFTYVGGTGRFEGIAGSGSYHGRRLAPLAPGGTADAWLDTLTTYTLPDR